MYQRVKKNPAIWLALGVAAGLVGGRLWPATPLHAVATDRHENFAIATGPVDGDIEALYYLDSVTGDLMAAVLSAQTGRFMSFYKYNILADLEVEASKNPQFLMVTGVANLRRGRGPQQSTGVVYIAELTSGKVAAYSIPWTRDRQNAAAPITASLVPLDVTQFRTALIRDQQ